MSEHSFGLGRGKVPATTRRKIDRIAAKHGAAFTNPDMPGEGHRYWFSCPNRGEPFDSRTARAVLADVAGAGIELPGWGSRARPGNSRPPRAGEASDAVLKARVTGTEKQRVAEHCAQAGTTESNLIRSRLSDVLGG